VTDALPHDLDAMAETGAYNAWLVDRAGPWIHGRVLDAGAGIGTHTLRLLGLADEVVALEPEAELAGMLRTRAPRATVVEGDVWSVEGPFDTIVCFNVLEHIRDDRAVIARFGELLAPGGAACVIVPAHPRLYGPLDEAFGHERRYSRRELHDKLVAAGLEPVVLRHVNPAGAVGWFVQSRVLHRTSLPRDGLSLYDRLVPAFRAIDRVPTPVGLSLWAVAKTTGIASASATNV
jgi:SAM-dependent methyltransferase